MQRGCFSEDWAGVRSHVCQPRPPPLNVLHPQEHWAGLVLSTLHILHLGQPETQPRKKDLSHSLLRLSVEAQGRGSLHDSGAQLSHGFGGFGTIAELWIPAHYHKWAMWMSVTATQAIAIEWWVPMPSPMTWASLSYLLSCAFSLTGPDLPKSRG